MITKAIKYGTQGCGQCKVMERNLKECGLDVTSVDIEDLSEETLETKNILTVPFTEFYTDDNTLATIVEGLVSKAHIQEIIRERA